MINSGSLWRRWEPHIHAPGTLFNDQFGSDSWEDYLRILEEITPSIEAIAITDYYVTDTYESLVRHKQDGRIPNIKLLFPNVELRLDIAAKTGFVNIHLLVCPEDEDHLEQLRRILSRLSFQAFDDQFDCTKDDLIKLGKKADPTLVENQAALAHGAMQFKVNFRELKQVIQESDWAKNNILIAVAGAEGDGTSGVRQAADATLRQEIESFAHIIFASSPAQREFWLGQRSKSVPELIERYKGCKPCIHGSDAHELALVGKPDDDRFTWVKGALTFDALRQACIDPEGRAYVGKEPPSSPLPSQVISHLSIHNASWAQSPEIPLNPGLVAIIGSRGSGKTALADMLAAASDSIHAETWDIDDRNSPSFLVRAKQHLNKASITIKWGGGQKETRDLNAINPNSHLSYPRARYLSQQFVEELCSSTGISDGLIEEIERVVFESHPLDTREGTMSFDELRENKTNRFQQARLREADSIRDISDRIAVELEKEKSLGNLLVLAKQKEDLIKGYKADLAKLITKGSEQQIKRHSELSETAKGIRNKIQGFTNQRRTFLSMQDEVSSTRTTKAPELLRQAKERHHLSGLEDAQWNEFLLDYKGKVDESLTGYINWADEKISKLTGTKPEIKDPNQPIFDEDQDLSLLTLSQLSAEIERIESILSEDRIVREQYSALNKRILQEETTLKSLRDKINDANGSEARRKKLQLEREQSYERVFQSIENQEQELKELYRPLSNRLSSTDGTLSKLKFVVRRIVKDDEWCRFAEENLLDLRKSGPFSGRGAFTNIVKQRLSEAWNSGTSFEVKSAMSSFLTTYLQDILLHAPYSSSQISEYRNWLKDFAQWIFSTDHILIRYEITYEDIEIDKLSPGTRGVVLLLLYLALDQDDDRPLIIDQPEENLDPKSVNDELVPLFLSAKTKRQVIMVTHNANLVINTDADQIIIAEAGAHQSGGLPPITYRAGGLEDEGIRKTVCEILEGGEHAFQERARRLRVRLKR